MPRENRQTFTVEGYKIDTRYPKLKSQGTARSITLPMDWSKVVVIDQTEEPDAAIKEARDKAKVYKEKKSKVARVGKVANPKAARPK